MAVQIAVHQKLMEVQSLLDLVAYILDDMGNRQTSDNHDPIWGLYHAVQSAMTKCDEAENLLFSV